MAANCGAALRFSKSVAIITFRTSGASSLSNPNNFAPKPNSAVRKPVALPPGRARLRTSPKPTGSVTAANTIGIVRLIFCSAITLGGAIAKKTSGESPTSSFAFSRKSSSLAPKRHQSAHLSREPSQALAELVEMLQRAPLFPRQLGAMHQHANASHPWLLRSARERPRRRAAEKRNEIAPFHCLRIGSRQIGARLRLSKQEMTPRETGRNGQFALRKS